MVIWLLLPVVACGQPKLKGDFVSRFYVTWIFNEKTGHDDRINPPGGSQLTVRFSNQKVSIVTTRGIVQKTYKILSAKANRTNKTSSDTQEYTYNLKDDQGNSILLLAGVNVNGTDFQFDFFKGNSERTVYCNKFLQF